MSPSLHSKLPHHGASVFSTMTELANQHGALNLSQGFPDYAVDPQLSALVYKYMQQGHNQYAPMAGMPLLRQRISGKYQHVYGLDVDDNSEITVTSGATEALFCTMACLLRPGDEVIVFEPAYDSYAVTIALFGATVVPIRLSAPDFAIDWQEVAEKTNERTRLIIINNPNNPSGRVLQAADFVQLSQILHHSNAFLLSDEVYEHLVYDGIAPQTVLQHPALRQRAFVVASFGKLLHATGWKVGYCIAPPALMAEFRKVHQYNVFSVHTPTQLAIAEYLENPDNYMGLPAFFQQKRDFLLDQLQASRFEIAACQGTYFLNLNYRNISDLPEPEFAIELVKQHQIATVPVAAFYHDQYSQQYVRLCFAKSQDTLAQAVAILNQV